MEEIFAQSTIRGSLTVISINLEKKSKDIKNLPKGKIIIIELGFVDTLWLLQKDKSRIVVDNDPDLIEIVDFNFLLKVWKRYYNFALNIISNKYAYGRLYYSYGQKNIHKNKKNSRWDTT